MKVQQAKAKLKLAQTHYDYTRITAPFDGYIDRIPYKVGSLVTPQSLLTTVSDVSEVFAYYKVNESEYLCYSHIFTFAEKTNLQRLNYEIMNDFKLNLSYFCFVALRFYVVLIDRALSRSGWQP